MVSQKHLFQARFADIIKMNMGIFYSAKYCGNGQVFETAMNAGKLRFLKKTTFSNPCVGYLSFLSEITILK